MLAFGGFADVRADVLGEFIGGDDAVLGFVGVAFQATDDIVGEDAVAAAPVLRFERPFAGAAGGHRKHRTVQTEE